MPLLQAGLEYRFQEFTYFEFPTFAFENSSFLQNKCEWLFSH